MLVLRNSTKYPVSLGNHNSLRTLSRRNYCWSGFERYWTSNKMKTILVVEDEPIVRNFVVRVLAREDYRVFEADSAAEALDVANHFEQIDLLITDHAVKTMTGRELIQHLCVSRPSLKVLQISGYAMD